MRNTPNRGRSQRLRRRRVSTGSVVAAGLVLIVSAVCFELALPGVGDANARVAEIVRCHHGILTGPPLPVKLADSVIAVEDEHFYDNVLVDVFSGAARAALASLREHGDPGGSTIAQQLAKQLYPQRRGLGGTLEELGLGVKLSLVYSKEQILQMYLNVVDYGNGYWGDAAASRGYFGVTPDKLSWAEASLLAGLVQGPSLYNPFHHFALAKERQLHVIDQLADNHYLSTSQATAASRDKLPLKDG